MFLIKKELKPSLYATIPPSAEAMAALRPTDVSQTLHSIPMWFLSICLVYIAFQAGTTIPEKMP